MERREVVQQAWQRLEPCLEDAGYELVEVEFDRQGGRWVLRIFMDREGGVTLDDCQAVSQMLSPILDEEDFVDGSYALEVSSPGIDRPIRKPKDFERFTGEPVRLRTVTPVDGRRKFRGVLKAFSDGLVSLECDGTIYDVHVGNVHKANLDR
jgi:ribosome maturation factor RimP